MNDLQRIAQPQVRRSGFPLYDTWKSDGIGTIAAQTIRLFQNGIGSVSDGFAAPGKTSANTNLQRSGGLPLSQSYIVRSFGVSVWNSDVSATVFSASQTYSVAQDVQEIAREGVISYQSGALNQIYGPSIFFPAGYGVVGFQAGNDSSAGTVDYYSGGIMNNGIQAAGAKFTLPEPIILTQGQSFSWNIEFPTALTLLQTSATYSVQICLWGESFQEVTQ